jgi:hypothetical protein
MARRRDTRAARTKFAAEARKHGRGSKLPSPAQSARFNDSTLLWYTPPETGGELERQPVLGGGGVVIDAIQRTGNHVAKSSDVMTFKGVTGLWRVRAHFAYEDENKDVVRKLWRSQVVSIPANADPNTRSAIIARAVTQMGRSILEHDYEVGMALVMGDVWVERDEDAAGESAPRRRNRKRDKKRDKTRPRKPTKTKKATPKKKAKPKKKAASKKRAVKKTAKRKATKKATKTKTARRHK